MRIVSLLPSATEIVFALGLQDELAGVTYECDHPDEAREKPVVLRTSLPHLATSRQIEDAVAEKMAAKAPLYELDERLIREIQPDLILAQDLCRVCAVPSGQVEEALATIGCRARVISLDPPDMDGILDGILEVGRATGVEDHAADLVAFLRDRIEAVRSRGSGLPTIRTLCQEWLDPPYAGGHWLPEMVELAAGASVLMEKGQPSRRVSWSAVADAQPEVVVHMPCGYSLADAKEEAASLYTVPEFLVTSAAASGSLYAVDATSYFSRPGPRIVDGLEILAWCIHPDASPEPPPGRVVRVPPP